LALAESRVHAEEVCGEQRRFIAAGASAELGHGIAIGERIARKQQWRERLLEVFDGRLEAALFGARFGGHFGVVNRNELAHLHELVLESVELSRHLYHRHEAAVFPAELREFTRILDSGRVCEGPLDFFSAGEGSS
jgi:hypothetical protein